MQAVIFVTDDEQVIRGAITKRLTRQGHHVVGYESGEVLPEEFQHNFLMTGLQRSPCFNACLLQLSY